MISVCLDLIIHWPFPFFSHFFESVIVLFNCPENNNLGLVSTSFHKSNLKFKYETLEKATDYFSASRKVGQGGAGSVFMGILPNGKTVAVKRLIFNTRQWVDEFFNEVNLISGIHHKNLVQLLGCSIEGPESLLVYEYVQNKSLDQFIFGKSLVNFQNTFYTARIFNLNLLLRFMVFTRNHKRPQCNFTRLPLFDLCQNLFNPISELKWLNPTSSGPFQSTLNVLLWP